MGWFFMKKTVGVISDFNFKKDDEKKNAEALLISILNQKIEKKPCLCISGNEKGAGKSMLGSILSILPKTQIKKLKKGKKKALIKL